MSPASKSGGTVVLRRKLNTFDVTNLVIGSIIGADIYVAAAIGAQLVGPSSIVIWLIAGIMAMAIAMSFAHCAMLMPRVGGPYAYVKEVAGTFAGFQIGWALFLAEWFSLAVFPVAFAQYFSSLVPGIDAVGSIVLKGVFILIIFSTNVLSIKAAGRFNDGLTILKLAPLAIFVIAGLVFVACNLNVAGANFQPFVTGGFGSFGQALVLIFWAYAGFELSTLPADEVEKPEKTIPRAIVNGMLVVMAFYLLTNFVIIGSLDQQTLMTSSSPLMAATGSIFGSFGILATVMPIVIGVGALISILGADESGTIGASRLAFALSADGLLPKSLSKLSKKHNTPYISLFAICITAFVASIVGGLSALISASVFLLSFSYLATSISAALLAKRLPDKVKNMRGRFVIPFAGASFSLLLMFMVDPLLILVSAVLLVVGIPIYVFFSPKEELREIRESFLSRDAVLRRAYEQGERFLAYPVRRVKWAIYKRKKINIAWSLQDLPDERVR